MPEEVTYRILDQDINLLFNYYKSEDKIGLVVKYLYYTYSVVYSNNDDFKVIEGNILKFFKDVIARRNKKKKNQYDEIIILEEISNNFLYLGLKS